MFRLFLFLAMAICAEAQIATMTTDLTGSVLYFSADLVPAGATLAKQERIYRWDRDGGLRVHMSREPEIVARSQPGAPTERRWTLTNNFRLVSPSVSSDGQRLAVAGHADCQGCSQFVGPGASGEISVLGGDGSIVGTVAGFRVWLERIEISRNGSYVAGHGTLLSTVAKVEGGQPFSTLGLPNGYNFVKPFANVAGTGIISGTGLAVGLTSESRLFVADHSSRRLREVSAAPAMAPSISPDGTWILFESLIANGQPRRLMRLDLRTETVSMLFTDGVGESDREYDGGRLGATREYYREPFPVPMVPLYRATMNDSGSTVLALVRDEGSKIRQWLVLIDVGTGATRWLGWSAEGYRDAVLSGDGSIIFAITALGRIVRIRTASDEVEEILPSTTWVDGTPGPVQRGSAGRIRGAGLAAAEWQATEFPAPREAGGVRVTLDGEALPLLKVSPSEIVFQVPFELPEPIAAKVGEARPRQILRIETPALAASPLRMASNELQYTWRPLFNEILHESGETVSISNPARGGETIRAFARGFSRGSGVTGTVAAEPADPVQSGFDCVMTFDIPGRTVFAGPAPGRIGEFEFRFKLGEITKRPFPNNEELICEDQVTGERASVFLPLPVLLP